MADICSCNVYSSRTQGLLSQRYSFPKKLLVAICLSVLIAMCLTPTEAASLGHNQRRLSMTETKDTERLRRFVKETEQPPEAQLRHRKRHQRHQPKLTKDEEHMNKIIRNLKLTLNDFREHKFNVNDSEIYRNPKIKIPTTNFLEIRRFLQGLKNKSATPRMLEHKFVYIAVRLYKSLFKYSEIFKALQKVNVVAPDVLFSAYQARRALFLNEIVRNLNYILPVIGDGLTDFKRNISLSDPLGEKEKQLLENFKLKIEGIDKAETCLTYDGTIFRGYGLTLNKWYCVVSSKSDRKHKENMRCRTMEAKMRSPKIHRKQKKKRRINNI